ncbi:N-6 DNA methylase [Polymorphospora sp. NPDC051019]|uniref:N-6 DNA methylase n=1 Tax=Polymorphospora sp. NPDC051019 TaxID=3155725 RepID=UPI003416A7B8
MNGETTRDATVAANDIARLAGVGRAAVSNWRRRFPDFPEPVGGTSASPLYSLADMESWLTRHGKPFELRPGDRIWQQIRGVVDELRLTDLLGYLGAFLVLLVREPDRWQSLAGHPDTRLAAELGPAIAAAAPEVPALDDGFEPEWSPIVRSVADLALGPNGLRGLPAYRDLFDFLYDRYHQVHSRRYAISTPADLAEQMVKLAGPDLGTVLDPACGIGTLLRTAHDRGAAGLLGQEIDGTVARLAAVRLLLHAVPARVVAGDAMLADAYPGQRADTVVCDPPFNERAWGYDELTGDPRWEYGLPPRGEPELAWVQHCLARVRPGGRVVIAMPASAASRRAGRRIRANLLRTGALRAVISLSGGATPATAVPDLWVLHRPDPARPPASDVLLVDASDDPTAAAAAWRAYIADPAGLSGGAGPYRVVRIIDLLDDEVDVGPLRYLTTTVDGTPAGEFPHARQQLLAAAAELTRTLPELATRGDAEPLSMTTVGELARAALVVIHQAPLKMGVGTGGVPVLTVKDVLVGRAPSEIGQVGPGTVMIQPGDVVVPVAAREPAARVLDLTGVLLGPQLLLVRPAPERIDPHFLAGFLRAAQNRSGGPRGSSLLARTDVRRVPIPRLPLDEQHGYGEAFRRLAALEDILRETAALAETVIQHGFAGLADGSLRSASGTD